MNGQLTLYELNIRIRDALQSALTDPYWVVAEISEMKENRSGHCYMELIEKDEYSDNMKARIRANIWSYTWRMLRSYFESTTGQAFREGLKVLVQVTVEFHPSYGVSLNIKDIDPNYTMGDLVRRRREIIRKLEEAGVIRMNRELSFSLVPQRIAVISSATAAGYQDFVNHLENNSKGFVFHHVLFESYMQGSETVPGILSALDQIYQREDEFDAVVIIRGGGSTVDLSSFDSFDLAFVLAQFPLPVITGIGHEKDDTIVDLVAHTRLKTPTAVAEFFVSGIMCFYELLEEKKQRLGSMVRDKMNKEQKSLSELADSLSDAANTYLVTAQTQIQRSGNRFQQAVSRFTFRRKEELQQIRYRLMQKNNRYWQSRKSVLQKVISRMRMSALMHLQKAGMRLQRLEPEILRTTQARLDSNRKQLKTMEEKLRLLDPQNILMRGYTLTCQNGKMIGSMKEVESNADLETRFADGKIFSKIIKSE